MNHRSSPIRIKPLGSNRPGGLTVCGVVGYDSKVLVTLDKNRFPFSALGFMHSMECHPGGVFYGGIMASKKKVISSEKALFKARSHRCKPILENKKWEPLSKLKNMEYSDFLKSNYWKQIRMVFLKKSSFKCQRCGAKNVELNVHHKKYDHRGMEWLYPKEVVVLCRECHKKEHGK